MRFRELAFKGGLSLYRMGPAERGGTVAVLFHGGAWVGGHPIGLREMCRFLAGYKVGAFSAQYRMLPRGSVTIVHEAIVDARDAVAFVARAQRPERLFVVGASSGGLLAIHAACARPELVSGVVLFNPLVNLAANNLASLPRGLVADVSPLTMSIGQFPRTLVLQGGKDEVTPAIFARRFVARLRAIGTEAQIGFFPEAGHGFYLPQPYRGGTFAQMRDFMLGKPAERAAAAD